MFLSIFGLLFGVVGAAIIFGIMILIIKFKYSRSRKNTDVSTFKKGYLHHDFSITTALSDDQKKHLIKHLSDHDATFYTGDNNEIIAYLHDFKQALLHGSLSVPWNKLALRIVIAQKGKDVFVTMDDDYRIKKKGYEKRVSDEMKNDFIQKCKQAFTFHQQEITKILKS